MFINDKMRQLTITIFSIGRLNLYFFHKRRGNGLGELIAK